MGAGEISHLSRGFGKPNHAAAGTRVVDHIRVQRIRNRVAAFSRAYLIPIPYGDLSIVSAACDSGRSAVLLRPINPIWKPMVGRDSIEFSGWLVVPRAPRFTAVHGDRRALIGSQNHSSWIRRIDPHGMVIVSPGRSFDGCEIPSPVCRSVEILQWYVHQVRILRVHKNLAHVPKRRNPRIFRNLPPRCTAIIRTEHASLFLFRVNNQINALPAHSRRHRNTSTPPVFCGKPISRDLRPGNSAIFRFVKPATRLEGLIFYVRPPNYMPQCCIDHSGVSRLETQIDCASRVVLEQNFSPTLPSIHGPENAALFIRPIRMA